jgi:short-subunit dehydrogenase
MKRKIIQLDKANFGPWAVVTGASSGIGQEFARQLATNGLNVVLVARRLEALEELGLQLATEFGIQYRVVGADLTDEDFLPTIEEATSDLEVGLLVSNAGDGHPGEFLNIERSELLRIVRLNVIAQLGLTHHFGRRLAERGRGGVLLVSAAGAQHGLPFMANDAASKAYVLILGEGLHYEFKKLGLNLTVLLPGPTATPMLAKFGLDPKSMPVKPMTVGQCAAEGLAALKANRPTHLSGRLNRIMATTIPHSVTNNMFGKMLGKAVAIRVRQDQP